jgi:cell division protein FtsB
MLLVTGTMATQVWHAGERGLQLHDQIAQVERNNAALENANQKLTTRTVRLRDPEYLVPLIHEQLGLTKPREIFIEVIQPSPAPEALK